MHKKTAAVDMAQEFKTEPSSFRSALNKPGDIRHNKCAAGIFTYSEYRRKSGEMIIGDFRVRGAGQRKQRRLSDIGKADETDIRQHFQLESKLPFAAL
ncbi:hypothetical protein SDC9_195160 [bioreactor metagenome]|uniref:Uncharacterized protein n=1 Tax=bioreactor metagenome TaxID=1076179 RepID=A0A645I878_9ZZZZ